MSSDGMRLVISGGGTAGHVYPALAMLGAWPHPRPEVTWIGTPDGMERAIVGGTGVDFVGVRAGPIAGQRAARLLRSAGQLSHGLAQALRALRRVKPDVVLTTGGYVGVPVGTAAWLLRIPLVVFLPDIRPGVAVRAQQHFATRIAVAFEDSRAYLPDRRTVVTGYPLRQEFFTGDRETARKHFGAGDDPLLLLYGGSRGARTLNHAVSARLDEILARCRFVHVCGVLDHADLVRRVAALTPAQRERYELHAFLGDRLVDAFLAADLCVARAGASTLAELPAAGVPAVVVPGPFSDQQTNAQWLASRGAAVMVSNDDAPALLVDQICGLLDDPPGRQAMAAASRALARRDAASRLIAELQAVC